MRRLDPYSPWVPVISGVVAVGAAALLATTLYRDWSWPLFAWGVLLGPVASAYAYLSTQSFARRMARRAPGPAEAIRQRQSNLWVRFRGVYAGLVLFGVAVGVVSGGLDSPAPDVVFTLIWLLVGVLMPLIAFRLIVRRLDDTAAGV
jgi:hypothetical protein